MEEFVVNRLGICNVVLGRCFGIRKSQIRDRLPDLELFLKLELFGGAKGSDGCKQLLNFQIDPFGDDIAF